MHKRVQRHRTKSLHIAACLLCTSLSARTRTLTRIDIHIDTQTYINGICAYIRNYAHTHTHTHAPAHAHPSKAFVAAADGFTGSSPERALLGIEGACLATNPKLELSNTGLKPDCPPAVILMLGRPCSRIPTLTMFKPEPLASHYTHIQRNDDIILMYKKMMTIRIKMKL